MFEGRIDERFRPVLIAMLKRYSERTANVAYHDCPLCKLADEIKEERLGDDVYDNTCEDCPWSTTRLAKTLSEDGVHYACDEWAVQRGEVSIHMALDNPVHRNCRKRMIRRWLKTKP